MNITLRGLLHGDGTDLTIQRSSNLWTAPDINIDEHERDGAHGVDSGVELLAGRRVGATIKIRKPSIAEALAANREMAAAWSLASSDIELTWVDSSGSFMLLGRPRLGDPNMENLAVGEVVVDCRFLATDPRIYSAATVTASTGRVTAGSGFLVPFTPPFTLGASSGGTARLSNVGTIAAPWTGVLTGPLVNPVIRNPATGAILDFRANGGLTLGAGEYVDLASDGQSVLLAGTADRSILLDVASRWWLSEPGFTDFELTADSGAGTLSLTSRDAWM